MNPPSIQLMIVGAQKAGTSSLLTYIGQHPDIVIHDELEFPYFVHDDLYRQGYEHSFSRLFGAKDVIGKVIAAKSAVLMYSEATCQRFYQHNSNALIVVMLRNPIQRAYSAYWHARRRGWETQRIFEDALDIEQARLDEGWDMWRRIAYVYNGIYLPHVIRLREMFGNDRVVVYTTDDLRSRPMETVQELFRRAGVDDSAEPNVFERLNVAARPRSETLASFFGRIKMSQSGAKLLAKRVLPQRLVRCTMNTVYRLNDERFSPPPMEPDTYARLQQVFAGPNAELGTLLNRDFSDWNQPPPVPAISSNGVTK